MDPISLLTIFVLAVFVGFEVVSKVSSTLHTPLMSGANAIHGIILVGAIIVAGQADSVPVLVVALIAVLLATVNLVGGFVVTDRMLRCSGVAARRTRRRRSEPAARSKWAAILYLVAAVCFILALKGLSSPKTARRGNLIGALGALIAVVTVFLSMQLDNLPWILGTIAVGALIAAPVSRRVQMTQMPQLVALFNGVGGGAAALVALLELPHSRVAVVGARDRVHDPGRRGVVRGLVHHVREAAGADDDPAGHVPRSAGRHGDSWCSARSPRRAA